MLLQAVQGVQGDPVHCSSKLVGVTLHKKALFPEDGNQWSAITSGGSGSDAAARGTKRSEVLMSFLEGVAPVSKPRRLHLTQWTQSWSIVKVSYLFGSRSSFAPVGRAASRWGVLFSSPLVARFLGGDRCGL